MGAAGLCGLTPDPAGTRMRLGDFTMVQAAETVELGAETLLAFSAYIGHVEAAVEKTLCGDQQFLWSDGCSERMAQLRKAVTIAELCSGKRPIQVPDGLIHDWIGATCVPGATMERTLALVQDYDNHKSIYPEVIASRLIGRYGDDFQIYLRLRKKKIITVILDTDHDAHYFGLDAARWCCHTRTTRISEGGRSGQAYRAGTAARYRIRIFVAAKFLLAIC